MLEIRKNDIEKSVLNIKKIREFRIIWNVFKVKINCRRES